MVYLIFQVVRGEYSVFGRAGGQLLSSLDPGPQEVPLGPIRLQMALPPFGCDPAAYTVRIQGAVVAILRGGGCSFGIKVINAQKLGAKAVMIVNTDDMKTMRLMALPDEVPLINIPLAPVLIA